MTLDTDILRITTYSVSYISVFYHRYHIQFFFKVDIGRSTLLLFLNIQIQCLVKYRIVEKSSIHRNIKNYHIFLPHILEDDFFPQRVFRVFSGFILSKLRLFPFFITQVQCFGGSKIVVKMALFTSLLRIDATIPPTFQNIYINAIEPFIY